MFKMLFSCLLPCLLLAGCSLGFPPHIQRSELVMDTVVQLTAEGPEAERAVEESFGRLRELEGLLSNFKEGSDAARLAESAGSGRWVQVSPEMYHLLEVSQAYSELTGGGWDITAGPLIKLWGIGTAKARVPASEEIEAAREKVGWQMLELDGRGSARLLAPGMELDLGGLIKGLGADEVRKIYQKHGIENGLINLGTSSLYALGKNKEGGKWRIGMKHPRRDGEQLGVVAVTDAALSTSGDYERFFEKNGLRYHHILDPGTGYPAWCGKETAERPAAVLVLLPGSDPDCGLKSDLLTTAVFVLGQEKGLALLKKLGAEGFIMTEKGKLYATPGLNACVQNMSVEPEKGE